jgi:hypothetical protein
VVDVFVGVLVGPEAPTGTAKGEERVESVRI